IMQEILKMLMNQTSLKRLSCHSSEISISNFTQFPGAKDCLTGLSKLSCSSNDHSEICYQLSQICHKIQSLTIHFNDTISNGLKDLISSQNRLKCLTLIIHIKYHDWTVIPSLVRFSTTLIKLKIKCDHYYPCN